MSSPQLGKRWNGFRLQGEKPDTADNKALQQERQRAEGLAREQQNSVEQARAERDSLARDSHQHASGWKAWRLESAKLKSY